MTLYNNSFPLQISTIHPARNEHDEIIPTCQSMLEAGASEIIVFDDGSDTPIPVFEKSIHIRNDISQGPSVCRNKGGEMARGDVLVFADAHTRIDSLHSIGKFAKEENCVMIPSMKSLYGNGKTTGYSRSFVIKGKNQELIGFDKSNSRPKSRYSYCYGNWGGFFIMPKEVFQKIGGWVNHSYWGYNDPSLFLKCFFCGIPTILDRDTCYKHKGKVKCGFGYPVKAVEPLLNLFHSYYVLFDKETLERHWLPLLEKSHKWMYSRGIEYIQQEHIRDEEKKFKALKIKSDEDFFKDFLSQKKLNQAYISFTKKVVAIMATVPSRSRTAQRAISSIESQVDEIWVAFNGYPEIPSWIKEHDKIKKYKLFKEDIYAGNAVWTFDKEDCVCFIIDDDWKYPSNYVELMSKKLREYNGEGVLTCHGSNLKRPFKDYFPSRRGKFFSEENIKDSPVDIGGMGVSCFYMYKFFLPFKKFPEKYLRDIQCSIYAHENNIPIINIERRSQWVRQQVFDGISSHQIKKDNVNGIREEMNNMIRERLLPLLEHQEGKDPGSSGIGPHSVKNISLLNKVKGIKGAFSRIKEHSKNKGSNTIWATEEEVIERQICCTTCTDGGSCPYCGCQIKKSWFLPLGKSELTTEGCPNPNTYPHLKRFPPKNYWQVTEEKTSVIIPSRNEKYLQKTVENLLETATGKIEILIGLDGPTEYPFDIQDDRLKIISKENPIGRRKICNELFNLSTGKFLFKIDSHCKMDLGWDTKLKCVCDDNNLVSCAFDELDTEKFEGLGNKWIGSYLDANLDFNWYPENYFKNEKLVNSMSFCPAAWMITRNTFQKFQGHQIYLGQQIHEELEWTLNIRCTGGQVFIRTDVLCAHMFKEKYNYEVHDNILANKNILKRIWTGNNAKIVKNIDNVMKEHSVS